MWFTHCVTRPPLVTVARSSPLPLLSFVSLFSCPINRNPRPLSTTLASLPLPSAPCCCLRKHLVGDILTSPQSFSYAWPNPRWDSPCSLPRSLAPSTVYCHAVAGARPRRRCPSRCPWNPVGAPSTPAKHMTRVPVYPKVEDNPLIYFLNHVLNLAIYRCNIDAIWRFTCMILEIRYIRVIKIEPRDNILNIDMIL